ncbi:hypothetical protein GCM10020000_17200 [Streptomyces olivoverticillatus]
MGLQAPEASSANSRATDGGTGAPESQQLGLGQGGREELLGHPGPYGRGRGRADAGPDRAAFGVQGDAEGADGDDHGVARADLGELLRAGGLADVHGPDQLVRGEGVALDAGVELLHRDQAGAAHRLGLDLGARREQRGVAVPGGGGGAQVAADAAAVADLGRADGVRGQGEAGQLGVQVVDDAGVGDGGAEADVRAVRVPLVELADAAQVQQVLGTAVVEVDLDHDVRAARDGHGRGMLGLGGESLLPVGGAQEVHE